MPKTEEDTTATNTDSKAFVTSGYEQAIDALNEKYFAQDAAKPSAFKPVGTNSSARLSPIVTDSAADARVRRSTPSPLPIPIPTSALKPRKTDHFLSFGSSAAVDSSVASDEGVCDILAKTPPRSGMQSNQSTPSTPNTVNTPNKKHPSPKVSPTRYGTSDHVVAPKVLRRETNNLLWQARRVARQEAIAAAAQLPSANGTVLMVKTTPVIRFNFPNRVFRYVSPGSTPVSAHPALQVGSVAQANQSKAFRSLGF